MRPVITYPIFGTLLNFSLLSILSTSKLFQAKPQRDRETAAGQNEHLHHGALRDDTDVPCDVPQAGQAHRAADGGAASENDPGCGSLLHRGPLQAGLPVRSGAEDADTASGRRVPVCGRVRSGPNTVRVGVCIAHTELLAGEKMA